MALGSDMATILAVEYACGNEYSVDVPRSWTKPVKGSPSERTINRKLAKGMEDLLNARHSRDCVDCKH